MRISRWERQIKELNFLFLCKMFAYESREKISCIIFFANTDNIRFPRMQENKTFMFVSFPSILLISFWILDVNIQQITDAKQGAQNTLRKYQKSFSLHFMIFFSFFEAGFECRVGCYFCWIHIQQMDLSSSDLFLRWNYMCNICWIYIQQH
jgi:hypothetical protein